MTCAARRSKSGIDAIGSPAGRRRAARAVLAVAALVCAGPARALGPEQHANNVLRVCGDPNNLPYSNSRKQGFENKIAALLARDLGWNLEYTWFPQRMGFIRNTLKKKDPISDAFACDLVVGVPSGYALAATTKPYYRSTYAMVFVRGHGLDGVRTPEDLMKLDPAALRSLKFGVFGRTPPTEWLLQHGLMQQAISYQLQTGDPDQYPGEVIEKDLAAGKIDVALAWGPIAGYFATKRSAVPMTVVAFAPGAGSRFDFAISMGVRMGDGAWKDKVERFLDENAVAIHAILDDYGVPQLDLREARAP